ncbi:L,D-transpeptidase [Methylocella sp.]|uniref:L,D-transpeptidase n=1 Tax=Methylocella sp. TaxID=1978226 RepID=UPI003784349D
MAFWRASPEYASLAGAFLAALLAVAPAAAKVRIDVDLSTQTLRVSGAGAERVWPVSTGRSGFATPRGSFHAQRLRKTYHSRKYHGAPMPHAIFFTGGYAIHGSYETGALGRPASHGCVRLAPRHAAELYALVKGAGATIVISGSPPATEERARKLARTFVDGGRAASRRPDGRERDGRERDWSVGEGREWDGW